MKIESVPIDSVHPDPANARIHPPKNLSAIKGSLARFGQQKPIVVTQDGVIRAGNGTWQAAKDLGWTESAVVRTALKGSEAVAFSIADNRTSELAEWDPQILGSELSGLLEDGWDKVALEGIGWDLDDLADLDDEMKRLGGEKMFEGLKDPDEVPEPPEEAITKPGDLWILGDHRLLCGDSAKPEDVDRLLAGAPVHMVNTDPPYNVKVEPRSNNAIAAGKSSFTQTHHQRFDSERRASSLIPTSRKLRAKDRPLENDFVGDEEYNQMLHAWFGNIARVLLPGRGFYIWGGYANCGNYPGPLAACGLYFSQAIIWVKEHPVLTRKDFMGNHEWCFYGWREGAAHKWFGPNNAVDVWSIKKVNPQSMIHLTEKPVELAVRAMQYSSQAGENVLDLFGGSGSTLIGAEQMRRKAFLMEIDPLYCDVIVERWGEFTGKKAVLETPMVSGDHPTSNR